MVALGIEAIVRFQSDDWGPRRSYWILCFRHSGEKCVTFQHSIELSTIGEMPIKPGGHRLETLRF